MNRSQDEQNKRRSISLLRHCYKNARILKDETRETSEEEEEKQGGTEAAAEMFEEVGR